MDATAASAGSRGPADEGFALRPLIARFVADEAATKHWSHRYACDLTSRLERLCQTMGWVATCDVPVDAYRRIAVSFAERGSAYIRSHQQSFAKLVRWPQARGFATGILQAAVQDHRAQMAPAFSPEQVRAIMRDLRAPKRPRTYGRAQYACTAGYAAAAAIWDYENRRALYPIIWMMMHWAMRPHEAREARVGDWNPHVQRLTIRSRATKHRRRILQVDQATARLLTRVAGTRPPTEPLFPSRFDRTWTRRALQSLFGQALARLGLRGSLMSCVRYAVQGLAGRHGQDWKAIMAVTGHAEADTMRLRVDTVRQRKDLVRSNFDQLSSDLFGRIPPRPER